MAVQLDHFPPMAIILKRLEVAGSEVCCCDIKYAKRQGVLERTYSRAIRRDPTVAPKFYYTEAVTEPGYLGAARDNKPWPMKETFRQEISEPEFWDFCPE